MLFSIGQKALICCFGLFCPSHIHPMETIILGFRAEPCDKRTALWFFRCIVGIETQVFVCVHKVISVHVFISVLFISKNFEMDY